MLALNTNSNLGQPESSPVTTPTIGMGLKGVRAGHIILWEIDMNHVDFDRLVEQETQRMKDVMCSKSTDYSAADDKLFNFKLAAEVDGVSPIEALRGMWLKHRTSIRQGLDELIDGKCRPEKWWIEKLTDDRNYSILLQGLLTEKYFTKPSTPEQVDEFTIREAQDAGKGWYIIVTETMGGSGRVPKFLHKDLELHSCTGWDRSYAYGSAPGYYDNVPHAKSYIRMYKNKKFVCPEGWAVKSYESLWADDDYDDNDCGWYVETNMNEYLHKDNRLHAHTTGWNRHSYGEAPGYWPTKEDAELALAAYLEKTEC